MGEPTKKEPADFVLPTAPVKAKLINPKRMIIFGLPKIGKTTSIAGNPDTLVINFEDEVQTADGMVVYIKSYNDLIRLLKQIHAKGKPYKFGAIDTVTKLEEFCEEEAERLYMKTPMGKSWIKRDEETGKLLTSCGKYKYNRIIFMPEGAGYQYLRQAMDKITKLIEQCFEHVIYVVHVKEKNLLKDGVEFTSSDLALTGKIKQTFAANAHAIGYMTRVNGKNIVYFNPGDDVLAGCKIKRLEGKEFIVSEYDTDGNLITHWDEIYIKK